MRDKQSRSSSQLLHFYSSPFSLFLCTFVSTPSLPTLPSALNIEESICSFCRHHLFSIYLSSCVFSLSFSPSLRQGYAVRPFQSTGVVRSDGWLSTFCCLALRSWEIYRLADYQAWKPISLSHSSLASSIHTYLAPSISLFYFNIFSVTKKSFHNREMCAKQHWNLCIDTGKQLLLLRVIVNVLEGWNNLRVTRLVFDRISYLSSSSPQIPAPLQTSNTRASIHVPLTGGNYNIGKRCWANCCLKIVIALLSQPFLVMIVQRHYVNAIKWFHYYSCLH